MISSPWSVRFVLGLALVLGAAACNDDVLVPGPVAVTVCAGDACAADVAQGDVSVGSDADAKVQRSINFHVETAKGNLLEGTTTSASIGLPDDKYPDLGVQVDVVVATVNVPDGSSVRLLVNGKDSGATATVAAGVARLDKVTLPCTAAPLVLTVSAAVSGEANAEVGKTLVLDCGTACTAAIEPPPACLIADGDPATPGFQYTVIVKTSTPDCSHAYVTFVDAEGKAGQSAKVVLGGAASAPVTVTLSANEKGLIGAIALVTAVVEDQAHPERPAGQSAEESLTLTTEPPTISVAQPLPGQITLGDDTDPLADGVQLPLVGTVTTMTPADVGQVAWSINGVPTGQATPKVDDSFTFPLSFAQTSTYSVKITATNSCGLTSSKTLAYSVFTSKANLLIQDPAPGQVLLAKNDGDPTTPTIYEAAVLLSLQQATLDSEISIYCKKAGSGSGFAAEAVGKATVGDINATTLAVQVTLDVDVLGNDVVCFAKDNAPNTGQSTEVAFKIGLPTPCLQVVLPAGAVTVATTGLQIAVVGKSLDGIPVKAQFTSSTGASYPDVTVGTMQKGSLIANLPLAFGNPPQLLPDGIYALTFEAIDAWGNLASESLCSDVARTVTIDTQGPDLKITLPTVATLTTVDNPDTDAQTLGYQTVVEVQATDAVSVCLKVNGASLGCQPSGAGTHLLQWPGVTLQPNTNFLAVTGDDEFGNPSAPPPTVITLVSDKPIVTFVSPTSSVATAMDTISMSVKVIDPQSNAPIGDAKLVVRVNGKDDLSIVAMPGNDGTYTFDVTGLSLGSKTVQVSAAPANAPTMVGSSSVIQITFKTAKPSVDVSIPTSGTVFNLSSLACVPGVPGCITDVVVVTPNTEDGSPVTLTVTCAGTPTQLQALVKNGAATFKGATLTDQETCTLVAQVTDQAGQNATSPTTTVTVDRTAPTIGDIIEPLNKASAQILLVAADDVNTDPTDGVQINLEIQASGLPVGATVTLEVSDDGGTVVFSSVVTVKTAIADKVKGIIDLGLVNVPDGKKVKLVFTATDVAGNAVSRTVVAQVISDAPEVRINEPAFSVEGKACVVHADCGSGVCVAGACALPWNKNSIKNLTVATKGLFDGGDVRICSDAAGVSGAACTTPGFKVVATAKVTASMAAFNLSTLADGNYRLIAEAGFLPAIPWTSSLVTPFAYSRQRTIALDTVAPTIASLTQPTAAGVPSTCLSNVLQSTSDFGLPGGKFTFNVTMDAEDASIVVLVDNLPKGTGKTTSKTAAIPLTLAEGPVTISAVATDWVGNVGTETTLAQLQVDTIAPDGKFTAPSKPKLIVGDSLDVRVTSAAADVQGEPVLVLDAGALKAQSTFDAGLAVFAHAVYGILGDGTHTLQAVLVDPCGNTATIATKDATVTVDTQKPEPQFSLPLEANLFTDAGDADPAAGGYQVSAQFSTGDAVAWTLELDYDCDSAYGNCTASSTIASGAVTVPGGSEPAVLMMIPFGTTPYYSARLSATDNNGNIGVTQRGFRVQLSGCLVDLKGLPQNGGFNTQYCQVKGQNCPSITVPLSANFVGPCGAVTAIELRKGGVTVATAAPTDFAAAFDLVLGDGDKVGIEARVLPVPVQGGSSGAIPVSVDLTNPVLTFTAGPVLGVATPSSGAAVLYGKAQDLDGAAGHQLHAQLKVDDAGLAGGQLLQLQRSSGAGSSDLAQQSLNLPVLLAGTSQTLDIQYATLAEDATNVVTATVQDALGNIGTASFTAMIDWTPPAAVVFEPFAAGDLNPRRPMVRLTFAAVGDNGTSGTATSYEVRYARKAIATPAEFDAACDGKALSLTSIPAPSASGVMDQISLEGPDPRLASDPCKFAPITDGGLTQYAFAVRAVDAAGNKSAVSAPLSTDGLRLRYAKLNFSGAFALPVDAGGKPACALAAAGAVCDMKQRVAPVGDLNGDGYADMAIGGGLSQPLCIFYGRASAPSGVLADLDLSALTGTGLQCLANTDKACPTCTAGGLGSPVAQPRDVNGDGVTDLVVGFGRGAGAARGVEVFLGKKGGNLSTTPAVVITNVGGAGDLGVWRVTTIGNFNGDVSATGAPISDIVVTSRPANLAGVNYADDRVYVIPGSALWAEGKTVTIDLRVAASRAANNVATIHLASITGTQIFGLGLHGAGNIIPDNAGVGTQYDELAIAQNATPQQVILLKGRAWTGETDIQLSASNTGIANDAEAARFFPDFTTTNGVGAWMQTVEFDGDATPDLLIQHQLSKGIGEFYWLRGAFLADKAGKVVNVGANPVPLVGDPTLFPAFSAPGWPSAGYRSVVWVMGLQAIGNFADQPGAGHTDIVYGRPTYAPNGGANLLNIRLDLMRPASPIPTENAFEYDDLNFGNPFTPGDAAWGIRAYDSWTGTMIAPLGDFNGDGLVDIAVGSIDGSFVIVY